MIRWSTLPIHRKLVITSMVKTTVVLLIAMTTLLAMDVWRFRHNATASAGALAAMMAENIRVALALRDVKDVSDTLSTARLQSSIEIACAYEADGTLASAFVRGQKSSCPADMPTGSAWSVLAARAPVELNGTTIGHVYVQLTWEVMRARLMTAVVTSLIVLVLAAAALLVLSDRLHRRISRPITQLAEAARRMGRVEDYTLARIETQQDEVGELVQAFDAMVDRIRTTTQDLTQSNDALRREVEERRRIEARHEEALLREQEASRVKDDFLATVSHELRTPLNAILGWARILTTSSNPETIAKAAASLHRNALAQARVIDDLIDISRIVTGKLQVLPEAVDLCHVVESAVEAIRPTADLAGVTLTVRLHASPCVIAGDSDRLQQVVWNLLSNAVKFAPRGAVHVDLRSEGGHLRLTVSDTGVGIPPEFLPHVFDRFRQADATPTRDHGGLGVGLAIAKELVELHGGTIRAESEGRGSTFIVSFPQGGGDPTPKYTADVSPSLSGVSVLAVDDHLDTLEIIGITLTRAGATVRTASSAAEAIEIWRQQPSDVLLCDLAMPVVSGFALLSRIRDMDRAAGRLTPAIAVTAHATEGHIARSLRAGFQMHVSKPFDAQQLVTAVSTVRLVV
jgi:signal transduction histidine kinase/ActR/RegA family two-component response regulator